MYVCMYMCPTPPYVIAIGTQLLCPQVRKLNMDLHTVYASMRTPKIVDLDFEIIRGKTAFGWKSVISPAECFVSFTREPL